MICFNQKYFRIHRWSTVSIGKLSKVKSKNKKSYLILLNDYVSDIRLLARQASVILQTSSMTEEHDNTMSTLESSVYYPPNVTLETSQDTTVQSEISSTIVLQRINKEPWEPVSVEKIIIHILYIYCYFRNDWNY